MSKTFVFLVLLFVSPAAYAATSHTVNWDTGVNYVSWAGGRTFATGDSLVFNYDASHAVDEVSLADYTSCNTANPISSDSNSPTTVALTAAGTRYFICPRSNHCSQGMKLAVTVTSTTTTPVAPAPPSGGSTPPAGGDTPTPPTTTTSSPPPPAGGAEATLGGRASFVGGLLVALGAVLMG